MTQQVSDFGSNEPENVEKIAKAIGKSQAKRAVFGAVYFGKRAVKTAEELATATGMSLKDVLSAGRPLADRGAFRQTKKNKRTAYEKIGAVNQHKKEILGLAGNRAKLAKLVTKRRPGGSSPVKLATTGARRLARGMVSQVVVDQIDSFAKVKKVPLAGGQSKPLPEARMKAGIQKILSQEGKFQDWGGEANDLYTTRVRYGGKRIAAAFALKGPGMSGKLTPGKMGKNGDQIQRLFEAPAALFVLQYHGQVEESVFRLMHQLSIAKSVADQSEVRYCVIDGADSRRLIAAYPKAFK